MKQLTENKENLPQLLGLIFGTIGGLLLGMVMSKRADEFEMVDAYLPVEEEDYDDGSPIEA